MVVVARGLPSRASKKLGTGDDKCDPGAVFSRPVGFSDFGRTQKRLYVLIFSDENKME